MMKWPPQLPADHHGPNGWPKEFSFEFRSCLRKIRYSIEPSAPNAGMRAYPCNFCGGWHLARRRTELPSEKTK